MSLPRSPSGESTAAGVSAQESGNKHRRKTRWEPISPELESSLVVQLFVNFGGIRMEEGKKRLMCPFQLEADFASQVGDLWRASGEAVKIGS